MKQALIDFYLDYANNYLTVEVMAEHYRLDIADCHELISMGKKYLHENK